MTNLKKPIKYNIFNSFRFAFRGLVGSFKREPNLGIQSTIGIISTLYFLHGEETAIAVSNFTMAAMVISLEMVNTSFEYLCDLVEPANNEKVKFIKDVAAGAVLFASLGWLAVLSYGIYLINFG